MKTYNVTEVAKLFGVTDETVRNWLRSGELKGVRGPSKKKGWVINEADLSEFKVKHPRYSYYMPVSKRDYAYAELMGRLEAYERMKDYIEEEIYWIKYDIERISNQKNS